MNMNQLKRLPDAPVHEIRQATWAEGTPSKHISRLAIVPLLLKNLNSHDETKDDGDANARAQ